MKNSKWAAKQLVEIQPRLGQSTIDVGFDAVDHQFRGSLIKSVRLPQMECGKKLHFLINPITALWISHRLYTKSRFCTPRKKQAMFFRQTDKPQLNLRCNLHTLHAVRRSNAISRIDATELIFHLHYPLPLQWNWLDWMRANAQLKLKATSTQRYARQTCGTL